MVSDFKKRFLISTIATIPILLLSPTIQSIFSFAIVFPGSLFVLSTLTTCVYGFGGWPFLKGCVLELKQKRAGMMTLVALAITAAHAYSMLAALGVLEGKMFFWEVATLIDVMLLGHWIEMKSLMKSSEALTKLAHLFPHTAHLILDDESMQTVKLEQLKKGDKVIVKPGEKIPADGRVTQGDSSVNQALITGESKPVFKTKGDSVIGGAINQHGALVIEIEKTGKESYVTKIIELVRQASMSKSHAQTLADKAAFALTIIAIIVGLATLGYWLSLSTHFALERMITVMVITCPHALGLAIPLVISQVTTLAAKRGILIKNRKAFEKARSCDIVIFDKTGTLTTGEFGVTQVIPTADWKEEKIIRNAAAIEKKAEHSIAQSIAQKAVDSGYKVPHVANFKIIPGLGARGFVDGHELFVGSPGIMSGHKLFETNYPIQHATETQAKVQLLIERGQTVIIVTTPTEIKGIVTLNDVVRKSSVDACRALHAQGLELAMMTGDNEKVAENVAQQLDIRRVFANVLPEEKSKHVASLQEQGHTVIMVGDGINDAPALAQADVGIAIGSGTDIAAETADIILVENNLHDVDHVLKLSHAMHKKMLQNLAWATGYNVFAIPLAAGVLYHIGFILPPAIGALVMSLSTIIVAINSRRI